MRLTAITICVMILFGCQSTGTPRTPEEQAQIDQKKVEICIGRLAVHLVANTPDPTTGKTPHDLANDRIIEEDPRNGQSIVVAADTLSALRVAQCRAKLSAAGLPDPSMP